MNLDDHSIYVFVRQDLPLSQQLVQSNHAMFMMASTLPPSEGIPSVLLIGMPDQKALDRVVTKLTARNILHVKYVEPDFENALGFTAISTVPLDHTQKQELCNYRLWKHSPEMVAAVNS